MSRTRHGCVNHVNASRDICPRPIKKQFRKGCKKQAARILLDPGRLVQDRLRLAHSPFKSRTHGSAMAYTWPWPPVRTGALSASRAVSGLRRVCVNQQLTWRVPIARGTMQILVAPGFPQPMTSARFPVSGGNCPSQCFANVACRSRRRNIAISRISDGLFCSGNVGRSRRFSIEQAGHGNIQSLCNFDAGCECWALFCDRATSVECCAGSERIRPMPPHSHPPPPQGMQ